MHALPGVQKNFDQSIHERSWLDAFIVWVNAQAMDPNSIVLLTDLDTENENKYTYSEKVIQGMPLSLPLDLINPDSFDRLLAVYLDGDGLTKRNDLIIADDGILYVCSISYLTTELDDVEKNIEFIRNSRKIFDESEVPGGVYSSGLTYDLYEQYINVEKYLTECLIYVGIGVFFASFLFLFHPLAVCLMTFTIGMIIVEVYGFLSWCDLKVNGVSVINLVMAVGVCVEFTAHITRQFMVAVGDRKTRAQKSIQDMFAPVTFGAFSTILGVMFMAFAEFPYFTLYFFNMYMVIICFGWLNGIAVLPVILSVCGPPTLSTGAGHTLGEKDMEQEIEMEEGTNVEQTL